MTLILANCKVNSQQQQIMNEKNNLITEYIDLNKKDDEQFRKKEDDFGQNLQNNLQKCKLTDDLTVEGDDEQTDEDCKQDQLNLNTAINTNIQQRRRRKSSGKSKLNKMQSSSLSSNQNLDHSIHTEDAPQSSSSSLNSWIQIDHQNLNQINNLKKNLITSSCDTISEEEHRKEMSKRNAARNAVAIDDDIVSSSNDDDLQAELNLKASENNSKLQDINSSVKLDKKSLDNRKIKQSIPSCDSLSSSPTNNNISYDSSPIKSTTSLTAAAKLNHQIIAQNKENHLINNLLDKRLDRQLIQNHKQFSKINNIQMNNQMNNQMNSQQQSCLNCNHHNNNNYLSFEQQQAIPWLYDNLKREEAEVLLQKFILFDGLFLVRSSSKNQDNFVLSFVHEKKVKHCHIKKMESDESITFSLDDKTQFYDIKQLIEFYQLNNFNYYQLNSYFLPCKLRYFLVHKQ